MASFFKIKKIRLIRVAPTPKRNETIKQTILNE